MIIKKMILGNTDKRRGQIIKYFIGVAQQCDALNNFNALMAIVAGLNGSAIHRLRKTWDQVSQKKKTTFEELRVFLRFFLVFFFLFLFFFLFF